LHWKSERIILFGNSIGTACVSHLAAQLNDAHIDVGAIIMQSPFIDIPTVVKDLIGKACGSLAGTLVNNRFDNLSDVKHITSPIYFIHGIADKLIPSSHSDILYNVCPSNDKHILFINQATHNEFELRTDIVKPVSHLINQYLRPPTIDHHQIDYDLPLNLHVPNSYYTTPISIAEHHKRLADMELQEKIKREKRKQQYTTVSSSFSSITSKLSGLLSTQTTRKTVTINPNSVISAPIVSETTQQRISQQLSPMKLTDAQDRLKENYGLQSPSMDRTLITSTQQQQQQQQQNTGTVANLYGNDHNHNNTESNTHTHPHNTSKTGQGQDVAIPAYAISSSNSNTAMKASNVVLRQPSRGSSNT
jgi:hypothetical protein